MQVCEPTSAAGMPVVDASTTRPPQAGSAFAVDTGIPAKQVVRIPGIRPPGTVPRKAVPYGRKASALTIAASCSIRGHTYSGGMVVGSPEALSMAIAVQNWQGRPPSSTHVHMICLNLALWTLFREAADERQLWGEGGAVGLCRRLVTSSRAALELVDITQKCPPLCKETDPGLSNLARLARVQVLHLHKWGVDLELVLQPAGYTVVEGDGYLLREAHMLARRADVDIPGSFTHIYDAANTTSGNCAPLDLVKLVATNPMIDNFWHTPGFQQGSDAAMQRILQAMVAAAAAAAGAAAPTAPAAAPATRAPAAAASPPSRKRAHSELEDDDHSTAPQPSSASAGDSPAS